MSNKSIKLFFAGDFCSKPSASLITVSEELKDLIKSCDLKVVNFEVPLRPKIELPQIGYERFYQNEDVPGFLKELGFNLFSIATNHTFDWGVEGYLLTKSTLGNDVLGAGTEEEAYSYKVFEKDGIKIGIIALCYASRFGVFDDVSSQKEYGCAYVNDLRVNHLIKNVKGQVDYLLIMVHDGIEYIDIPLPEIRSRYKDFIEYGADAVIGTHPHCPQGWEEYKGKPIFYSIGNFFFNSKDDPSYRAWNRPHWYDGLVLSFTIDKSGLKYEVINTKNEDNVHIRIDHDPQRNNYNDYLCGLLKDELKYQERLAVHLDSLWFNQELFVIDGIIHKSNLLRIWKHLLKQTWKIIIGKYEQNDSSIIMLLKNDSRRNVVRRYLEIKLQDKYKK